MRIYYAIMNGDICVGMIDTFDEIERADYMRIDERDDTLISQRWTGTEWVVVE